MDAQRRRLAFSCAEIAAQDAQQGGQDARHTQNPASSQARTRHGRIGLFRASPGYGGRPFAIRLVAWGTITARESSADSKACPLRAWAEASRRDRSRVSRPPRFWFGSDQAGAKAGRA